MKTSLSHLPAKHQEQILAISKAIVQFFQPEKVILFGSFAKGSHIEDRYVEEETLYDYLSDYDILVVTKGNSVKDYLIDDKISNRFNFQNEINIISHDIDHVNYGLTYGQYFFTDIVKEGILLFDTETYQFQEAKLLGEKEQKEKAKDYYDMWFSIAEDFLIDSQPPFERGRYNKAVFELHQACENFYNTVLLVHTGYKPKTHNLAKLRNYTKHLSLELYNLFLYPKNDPEAERIFDLLKKGYVDARYKKDYAISETDTAALMEKVSKMRDIVDRICVDKIN